MIFCVHTMSAKIFLASRPFNKKCLWHRAFWPNFWDPSTLKIVLAYGYSFKKYIYYSIIWRWAVLCKKQDGSWIKIYEIFSGKSLNEDLSIDTTFDPFSWDSTFNLKDNRNLRKSKRNRNLGVTRMAGLFWMVQLMLLSQQQMVEAVVRSCNITMEASVGAMKTGWCFLTLQFRM